MPRAAIPILPVAFVAGADQRRSQDLAPLPARRVGARARESALHRRGPEARGRACDGGKSRKARNRARRRRAGWPHGPRPWRGTRLPPSAGGQGRASDRPWRPRAGPSRSAGTSPAWMCHSRKVPTSSPASFATSARPGAGKRPSRSRSTVFSNRAAPNASSSKLSRAPKHRPAIHRRHKDRGAATTSDESRSLHSSNRSRSRSSEPPPARRDCARRPSHRARARMSSPRRPSGTGMGECGGGCSPPRGGSAPGAQIT